jgi:hypothetical protein
MLSKLLSLIVAGKGGAAAAAAIVAGATTVGVMTTSPEVQDTMNAFSQTVSGIVSPGMSELAKLGKIHDECEKGQPVVVAQRNTADKLLRDAYQDEHKRLTGLHGGKDVDHQKANDILQKAERDLRGVLTTALNDVARDTLGREGQLKEKESEATSIATATPTLAPAVTTAPTATETPIPKPSCAPKPSASPAAAPAPSGSPSAEQRGRVEVASRVTLNAKLQGIVDTAKVDMKKIVDTAETDLKALPAVEHGKSGDKGKPEDERGKPEDKGKPEEKKDAEHGKPSERPGVRPSSAPAKP